MRISVPIAAANGRQMTRIPFLAVKLTDCMGKSGKLDREKGRRAFLDEQGQETKYFRHSKGDDEYVYLVGFSLMDTLAMAFDTVAKRNDSGITEGAVCKQDRINQRKFDRGKCCYAHIFINRQANSVRVRLALHNPEKLVGIVEHEARDFLVTCAEIILRAKHSMTWVEIEDNDIFAEARERNERAELKHENEKRLVCPNRTSTGFCSPINPRCKFYSCGRCVEIKG